VTRCDAARRIHVTDAVRPSRRLGIIGSAVRLLALLVSSLTYLLPDSLLYRPVTQVTEAATKKDSEHVILRIKRLEIKSRDTKEQRPAGTTWEQAISTAAVSLALLAIVFAVFAVIFREEKLLADITVVLGGAAIAVQVWWVVIIIVFAMIIANRFVFPVGPSTSGQMPFARGDHVPDRFRDRDGAMGLLVGIDPHDLAGHQRVIAALQENGEFEADARIADPRHPRADVEFPVEAYRRLVFDQRFDDVKVDAGDLGVGKLVVAECAKILGDGGIEIGQIMRVEHDALAVDLGIPHPERMEEPELLA
jgi:hypothetical protein